MSVKVKKPSAGPAPLALGDLSTLSDANRNLLLGALFPGADAGQLKVLEQLKLAIIFYATGEATYVWGALVLHASPAGSPAGVAKIISNL